MLSEVWDAKMVDYHGGFGRWAWDVSFDPADIVELLSKHPGNGC
jgi:hypothetical protein